MADISRNVQRSDLLQMTTPTRTVYGLPVPRTSTTKWPAFARSIVAEGQEAIRGIRRAAAASLPEERDSAVREVARGYLAKLDAAATEVATARRGLRVAMAEANAFPPLRDVSYTEAFVDLELAKRVAEMPAVDRAALVAQCEAEPMDNTRFNAALTRTPPELSRISRVEQTAMRVAALQVLKFEVYAALRTEAAEMEVARDALRVAAEGLADVGAYVGPVVGNVVRDPVIEWPATRAAAPAET